VDIIVLLKQVAATESIIDVAKDGVSIKTDDIKYVINPYDELAVEEALQIREDQGGQVIVLSMGAQKADEAIRTALAMGADKGLRIDMGDAVPDSLATARILSKALQEIPFDLIIGGHRAVDDDSYHVGPAVAEMLGIPSISMVIEQKIQDGQISCVRTVDGGTVELKTALPALITTQRGLNDPRYASLPGIMKAKKKPIDTKTIADLGLSPEDIAPAARIVALKPPPERAGGRIIEGDSTAAKVKTLVKTLSDEAKVI
jgi:electron transfer flavoprotein beta subunit